MTERFIFGFEKSRHLHATQRHTRPKADLGTTLCTATRFRTEQTFVASAAFLARKRRVLASILAETAFKFTPQEQTTQFGTRFGFEANVKPGHVPFAANGHKVRPELHAQARQRLRIFGELPALTPTRRRISPRGSSRFRTVPCLE